MTVFVLNLLSLGLTLIRAREVACRLERLGWDEEQVIYVLRGRNKRTSISLTKPKYLGEKKLKYSQNNTYNYLSNK
jgi:hypothetical protein